MIRKILLSALMIGLVTPVFAAGFDEQQALMTGDASLLPSPFDGFYLGIDGGGNWKQQEVDYSSSVTGLTPAINKINAENDRRFMLGVHGGYSWVFDRLYLAAEVFANANIGSSTEAAASTTVTYSATQSLKTKAVARIKNSYGVDFRPGFMVSQDGVIYAILGLQSSKAQLKLMSKFVDTVTPANNGSLQLKKSKTNTGYRFGFGFQQRLSENWSGRIEYTGVKFKKNSKKTLTASGSVPANGGTLTTNGSYKLNTLQLIMVGVSYHFF